MLRRARLRAEQRGGMQCQPECHTKADGATCDDGSAPQDTDVCTTGMCGPCVPSTTASPRFVDNGDGTITDRQTCLVWEKKNDAGGGANVANPHDVDNTYTWTGDGLGGTAANGTAFTDFLVRLNNRCAGDVSRDCSVGGDMTCTGIGSGKCGFAGHRDWRLPTSAGSGQPAELESIVAGCGSGSPCINPIFVPTAADNYWSSSPVADHPSIAWLVNFADGSVNVANKGVSLRVRAVRGGQ